VAVDSEELSALIASCSNSGRWGEDDELGTLNLITPDVRRRAAGLVREGVTISLASDLSLESTPYSDSLEEHSAYADPAAPMAVADSMWLRIHGWSTHLDALGHIYNDGVGYNGRLKEEVFDAAGLRANAITAMRDGIFTRGVLLDVAAALGRQWLPADHGVSREELDEAERRAGIRVEAGDAVFVHVGLKARLRSEPSEDSDARAGLRLDAVIWLWERDVALFGGDCVECLPGYDAVLSLPLHQLGIAAMGLALLDWPDLERLLAACARYDRHDFLFTVAPLPIVGGTGSPVNPIVAF
jgi:kynurenine formamidase